MIEWVRDQATKAQAQYDIERVEHGPDEGYQWGKSNAYAHVLAEAERRADGLERRHRPITSNGERTFVENNYWRCPRCGTWDDDATCPGCDHKRQHVARIAYECQRCFCIQTATALPWHNCEMCSL